MSLSCSVIDDPEGVLGLAASLGSEQSFLTTFDKADALSDICYPTYENHSEEEVEPHRPPKRVGRMTVESLSGQPTTPMEQGASDVARVSFMTQESVGSRRTRIDASSDDDEINNKPRSYTTDTCDTEIGETMAEEHEIEFYRAVQFVRGLGTQTNGMNEHTALQLYAFFKQATEGPCQCRLGNMNMTERAKMLAWKSLGDLPRDGAMKLYVKVLDKKMQHWRRQRRESAMKGDERPILEGTLLKKAPSIAPGMPARWQKRWVVLTKQRVRYYKSEAEAAAAVVRGEFLTKNTEAYVPEEAGKWAKWSKEKPGLFVVAVPASYNPRKKSEVYDRVFYFSAHDEQERDAWIHAINREARLDD